MSSSVKFTYDQDKKVLIVNDDGVIHKWLLTDEHSQIFFYMLKAIDLLDDDTPSNIAEWAKKDNTDKIPADKIDLPGVEKEIVIQPTNVFEESKVIETSDTDADKYVFSGGTAL